MRIRILSVIALLTLVWPATARAGSISLDTFFQGVGGTFVVAGQAEEFFVHGSVQMSNANGLGDLDALPSFEAFCVDFTTSIFDVPAPGDGLGTYNAELGSMVRVGGWPEDSGRCSGSTCVVRIGATCRMALQRVCSRSCGDRPNWL